MTATTLTWHIDEGPDTQPSLEYQHAFDLVAVEMHHHEQVGAVVSTPFYAYELLRRSVRRDFTLVDSSGWSEAWPGTLTNIDQPYATGTLADLQAPFVVWAEPLMRDYVKVSQQLYANQPPGAQLCVIAHGALGRFLPPLHTPELQVAGWRRTRIALRDAGYRVNHIAGFHGVTSIFWSYAYRALVRVGRDDLAARCLYQMRKSYAVRGAGLYLTTVNVLLAQKGA